MADVAAVGSVLIPAARRSGQNPGGAVALLAASAVMAETIPPCINLIILGFVTNLSISGLFMAGLLPAGLMALVLVAAVILFGRRVVRVEAARPEVPIGRLWGGAAVTLGLIVIIFGGFKSGFATATEISAFAALYALVVGGVAFRELEAAGGGAQLHPVGEPVRAGAVHRRRRAGAGVRADVAAGAAHAGGDADRVIASGRVTMFLLLSIAILIVMGSVLEGAAALIIFGPLLLPVATQVGIGALHYAVVLVIAMGIGLFAPPLGLGLYGTCLIGEVPIEAAVKPMLGYLGLLLATLMVIAFVPAITLWLPHAFGY